MPLTPSMCYCTRVIELFFYPFVLYDYYKYTIIQEAKNKLCLVAVPPPAQRAVWKNYHKELKEGFLLPSRRVQNLLNCSVKIMKYSLQEKNSCY